MALAKTVTYDMITIRANGIIEIRKKTTINEDGKEEFGSNFFRYTYEPGADISSEPVRVKNIINIVWTPAVLAAWEVEKAARLAAMPQ